MELKKMNPKEIAERLNGREIGKEVSLDEEKELKAAGLIVVFGASDDLMEFRGAINDEVGCYDGGKAYLAPTGGGLLKNACDDDDCPYFASIKEASMVIEAVWNFDGYSWLYETEIPHETFDIMEDGEKYCRGIVIAIPTEHWEQSV